MSFLHFFLPFDDPLAAGFLSLAAGFGFPGFCAEALRAGAAVSAVSVAAASDAAGARFGLGCACLLGFLPSVKISVMRRRVNSWR
jgi:hypothetical protein